MLFQVLHFSPLSKDARSPVDVLDDAMQLIQAVTTRAGEKPALWFVTPNPATATQCDAETREGRRKKERVVT